MKKTITISQRIKKHIIEYHKPILDMIREQNNCNHQWAKHQDGFKCENCDYYTGHDLRLNQLIKKLK